MVLYKNGWNVTDCQQKFLFVSCNITGLTSYYAYSIGSPIHVAYPVYAVWIASNLYWYNPTNGWRKKVDMLVVHIGIPFLSIGGILYKPPYWYITSVCISGSAVLFRMISLYYTNLLEQIHDKDDPNEAEGIYHCPIKYKYSWYSTLAHSCIHLFANVFVALLAYSYS